MAQLAGRAARVAMRNGNREKLSAWLSGSGDSPYELLRRVFLEDEVDRIAALPAAAMPRPEAVDASRDLWAQVSVLDLMNYMKNVLLRDTDAMSMAHSVEVRVPYLDSAFSEWVLTLPGELKAGDGKALLADATRDFLPPEILARRKQGFALPLSRWMAGELRGEVEGTLRRPPEVLAEVLDTDALAAVWEEFARDGRRWHRAWALYALCAWAATVTTSSREEVAA